MNFIQVKLLNKIDNLVKLSTDFDSGFKIIYNLDSTSQLDESKTDILYSMTKKYILMRKEHGELLLMMNKFTNSIPFSNIDIKSQTGGAKSNKNVSKPSINGMDDTDETIVKTLYDLSTFNTLLGNVNDLINNIDYEYKKIAVKYPKFINKKPMLIILITPNLEDKYAKLIDEIKISHPEHKYKIIKCEDKKDEIVKCEEELREYGIKIKSKTLPVIYIINNGTFTEIPISKIDGIEPIKNLVK